MPFEIREINFKQPAFFEGRLHFEILGDFGEYKGLKLSGVYMTQSAPGSLVGFELEGGLLRSPKVGEEKIEDLGRKINRQIMRAVLSKALEEEKISKAVFWNSYQAIGKE